MMGMLFAAGALVLLLLSLTRSSEEEPKAGLPPKDRSRRGRGFNVVEAANLASWGVKLRPEELDPPAGDRRDPRDIVENLHANVAFRPECGMGQHRWEEITLLGGPQRFLCVFCGKYQTQRPASPFSSRWWDMKRKVWRDEKTGRKVTDGG